MTSVVGVTRRAAEKARERPMVLVVAGGIVAFVAWLGILWAGYSYFVAESMTLLEAGLIVLLALPVYAFGVFAFAYGWEREDIDRARRLAFIVGLVGLAVLLLAALGVVVIAALAGLAGGGRSGSSRRGGSRGLSGGGRFDSDGDGGSGSGAGSGSRSGGSGRRGSFLRSAGRAAGEVAGGVIEGVAEGDESRRARRRRYVAPPKRAPQGDLVNCLNCGNLMPAAAPTCPICGHEYRL